MEHTDLIAGYRRFLKRRNYSTHTVKNYVNMLDHFMNWLKIPIEQVTSKEADAYMDHLLRRRKKPKTIKLQHSSERSTMSEIGPSSWLCSDVGYGLKRLHDSRSLR
jgi:site-specific recombinase XerD